MPKKVIKKTRIKFFNLFIMLAVLAGFVFGVYLYLKVPIKNIIINNNNYLNDDYILDLAKIKNYPEYYKYSKYRIKKNIMKSEYISDVVVKRRFFHTIEITVTEKKPLFYRDSDRKVVFSDRTSLAENNDFVIFRIPRVMNYVPNNIYKRFLKGMNNINDDTLSRISDIVYDPNDLDKERFLLYMDDGNMVYLTLTKGILYLDNGNHFQIKE